MNIRIIAVIAGVLLLAGLVGVFAYNAGMSNGLAQNGKVIAPPYPYYYPHHFWGGGFFFFPLFFIGFLLVARGLFWRRGWHHHHHYGCRYEGPRENDPDRR